MSHLDKAALLGTPELEQDDVKITGGTVRVRALTRFEAGQVQKNPDTDGKDKLTIAYGMVEPTMTESEAATWMRTGLAGDLVRVCTRIAELSGLIESSGQDAYKSDGDEPGSRV